MADATLVLGPSQAFALSGGAGTARELGSERDFHACDADFCRLPFIIVPIRDSGSEEAAPYGNSL